MRLPVRGAMEREGQMDVFRGEQMGRVDSIYNNTLSMTNPAQRSEKVTIIPLMAVLLTFVLL